MVMNYAKIYDSENVELCVGVAAFEKGSENEREIVSILIKQNFVLEKITEEEFEAFSEEEECEEFSN